MRNNKLTTSEFELQINELRTKNRELTEALLPFAEFGPDVINLKDEQAFMGALQIKAGRFKKAYALLVRHGVLSDKKGVKIV